MGYTRLHWDVRRTCELQLGLDDDVYVAGRVVERQGESASQACISLPH